MGDDPAPGVHAENGFHYKCRHSGALDVNADNGPGHREGRSSTGSSARSRSSASARSGRRPGTSTTSTSTSPTPARSALGGGDGGAVGALEETGLDVKLIDWDADVRAVRRLRRPGAGGFYGGPPEHADRAHHLRGAGRYADGVGPQVRLSAFEAAIVESGVHNLTYGDRDSLGRVPAAPVGEDWGTRGADHEPGARGATFFVRTAIDARTGRGARQRRPAGAGRPELGLPGLRYDQVQMQALALMDEVLRSMRLRARCRGPAALALAGCGVLDDVGPATQAHARSGALRPVGGHEQRQPALERAPARLRDHAEPGGRAPSSTRARSASSTWAAPSASSPRASTPPRI